MIIGALHPLRIGEVGVVTKFPGLAISDAPVGTARCRVMREATREEFVAQEVEGIGRELTADELGTIPDGWFYDVAVD